MEWFTPAEDELSIVAEALEQFGDSEEEFKVLNISEPPSSVASQSCNNAPLEYGSKDRFALLATGAISGQPMQFIMEKKKFRKKKRLRKTYFDDVSVGKKLEETEKKSFVSKFRNGNIEHVFPVKIASRKILNEQHFDKYVVGKTFKASENSESLNDIKVEIKDEFDHSYIEMCNVDDENGCSSVELEYGSGVSIYESVEAYESDGEAKAKRGSDSVRGFNLEPANFNCAKCSAHFLSKRDLQKHKSVVHRRKYTNPNKNKSIGFKCGECGAMYKRAYKFHCHLGSHDGRFTCDQCHRTFVRVTGFKKHLKQCHKVSNPNICVVCGFCFFSQESLDEHLQQKHPNNAAQLRAYFKQCAHCRYQFITELSFLNHQKNAPYHCHSCNMTFECNNKLGFHLNFKHKPQVCNYCGKEFEAFDQYTYHVRYYHTDKNIKCPYCDEHFRVKSRLLIHIDVNHTDGNNYKCNLCDYTAKNYASVNRHRRITHMPKSETHKNVCSICSKSFLVHSRLKVHMKSHSSDKPHVCQMCGRGYKFEYLLKRHQKNPELCLRVLFPNGTRLQRKGKRRCDMCNIGFESPDQLAVHMVDQHNVKIETNSQPVSEDQTDLIRNFNNFPSHISDETSRTSILQYPAILSDVLPPNQIILPDSCVDLTSSLLPSGDGSSNPIIVDYIDGAPVALVNARELMASKPEAVESTVLPTSTIQGLPGSLAGFAWEREAGS